MVLYNIRAISSCIIIMFLFISCKSDIKKINKYYQPNIEMHHVIADTLIKFVKKYKREVDIKVRYDLDSTIFFYLDFDEFASRIPVEFDRSLHRIDSRPERTSSIEIPVTILRDIRSSIYSSVSADSTSVFFGYEYIGHHDYMYGILIFFDTTKLIKENIVRKLSGNVYLYKDAVH